MAGDSFCIGWTPVGMVGVWGVCIGGGGIFVLGFCDGWGNVVCMLSGKCNNTHITKLLYNEFVI